MTASISSDLIHHLLGSQSVSSVHATVEAWANLRPEKVALASLSNRGDIQKALSYAQLAREVRTAAACLQTRLQPGDRVVLIPDDNIGFAVAFLATLTVGGIPVPAAPASGEAARRLDGIVQDCQPAFILSGRGAENTCIPSMRFADALRPQPEHDTFKTFTAQATTPAFIQYSSGSTGQPKGVLISHGNVLANHAQITDRFGHDADTIMLNWAPLFHDMGLMGGMLHPLLLGITCYYLQPRQFLARPQLWLRAISDFGVTTSGGPSFAYDHCLKRIHDDDLTGLDLSTWRIAYCGAEPIRPGALIDFTQRFTQFGLPETAAYPCYGMAEMTLYATSPTPGEPLRLATLQPDTGTFAEIANAHDSPTDTSNVICVGTACPETEVVILETNTDIALPSATEGEITLNGPQRAARYWTPPPSGNPADLSGTGPFRTGDLGFLLDGRLYVTGRIKELIIFEGRNIHPADVERVAGQVDGVDRRVVAFQADDTQHIVVLCEARHNADFGTLDVTARRVAQAIEAEMAIRVDHIGFLHGETLPKTTSGKAQRARASAMYRDNAFKSLSMHDPAGGTRRPEIDTLVAHVQALFLPEFTAFQLSQSWLELGLGSLEAARLAATLQEEGYGVTHIDILSATELGHVLTSAPGVLAHEEGTFAQPRTREAILEWSKLHPESGRYTLSLCLQPSEPLPLASVQAATKHLIDRHPILATPAASALPYAPSKPSTLPVLKTYSTPLPGTQAFKTLVEYLSQRPIDLYSDPSFRLHAFVQNGDCLALVLCAHHAVADLVSLENLLQDFGAGLAGIFVARRAEQARIRGRKFQSAPLPLSPDIRFATLPRPSIKPNLDGPTGAVETAELSPQQYESLMACIREKGISLNAAMLACGQVALAIFGDGETVEIEVPFHNRYSSADFNSIGCFVEVDRLQSHVSAHAPFDETLEAAQSALLLGLADDPALRTSQAHHWGAAQSPSGARYALAPTMTVNGLSPASLTCRGYSQSIKIAGMPFQVSRPERHVPVADLVLTFGQTDGCGLMISLEYDRQQIDPEIAGNMARFLERGLKAIAADPSRTGQQSLVQFAKSHGTTDDITPVAGQANAYAACLSLERHSAEVIACLDVNSGTVLTRQELAEHSTQVAAFLASLGIGEGDRVAVVAEHSVAQTAVMLGIWALGAVYCPIDKYYPEARISRILTGLDAQLVIDDPQNILDDSRQHMSLSPIALDGDAPAYIVHTSGTTGHPKGVVISHAALANTMAAQRMLGVQEGDKLVPFASLGFDASIFESTLALGSGATLCFALDTRPSADSIRAAIKTVQPDALLLPPSLLDVVGSDIPTPRITMCAGEACPAALAERWHQRTAFWNLYGPSETAIWATYERPEPGCDPRSIGYPIPGMAACIVDKQGNILPTGATGELTLTGAGLATGYLGLEQETRHRFVNLNGEAGRFYRTGDTARTTADGRILLLGRTDHQVKINGVRIELDDVRQNLLIQPSVRAASVWTAEGPAGKQIIAAIEATSAGAFDMKALRGHLYDHLPPAFVPSEIHLFDALPIDAHGKLDQKAIAMAVADRLSALPDCDTGCACEWESDLIAAALDVLPDVSLTAKSDLLAAGLNSLHVLQFCSAVTSRTGRKLDPKDVYVHSNIGDLAKAVSRAPAVADPTPTAFTDTVLPLTPVQSDLWLMHQMGEDWKNTISIVVALEGLDNQEQLEQAILRTFESEPVACLRIDATEHTDPCMIFGVFEPDKCLQNMVLSGNSLEEVEVQTTRIAQEGFNLATDPPLRLILWSDTTGMQYLQLVAHHIAVDGWAAGLLLARIGETYYAQRQIYTPKWDIRPVLQHHLSRAERKTLEASVASHVEKIGKLDPPPNPVLRHRGAVFDEPQRTTLQIDPDLWRDIVQQAAKETTTGFRIVAGAFAIALARREARNHTAITVVNGNRTVNTAQAIFGLAEPVPIGVSLDDHATLDTALKAVSQSISVHTDQSGGSLSQFHAAYEKLFDEPKAPFLDCFVVQSDTAFSELTAADTALKTMPFRHGGIKAQILLEVREDGQGCTLLLENAPGRITPRAANMLLVHTAEVLRLWLAAPSQPMSDVPHMPACEKQLLITEFQGAERYYDFSRSAAHIAADVMQQKPDAIVLEEAGKSLTAGDMTRRANRLANQLISVGTETGMPVGVCVPFGIDRVVALHGVMRSGAAFVPLSPDLPAARLGKMIRQLNIRHVITPTGEVPVGLDTEDANCRWVAIDKPGSPITLPDQRSGPNDHAYILFTSGSTGQPKAVANTHKGLLNRIFWMQDLAPISPDDVVLQKTDYTFDVSVWEIFWPFMMGAKLRSLKPDELFDMQELYRAFHDGQVSVAHFVPSVLREFLAAHKGAIDLPNLRNIFTSGEALERSDCEAVTRQLTCDLYNYYGPTEAAIDVTAWHQSRDLPVDTIPIGHAVPNTQLYVLMENAALAPIGVPGELYIAGAQVAEGYYNDPARTSASFTTIEIDGQPVRAYRSGDIARWRDDGTLAYLGRSDDQVKLRGIRVEPGEVQATLIQHPGVSRATVLATGAGLHARLVAFFVPTTPANPPSLSDLSNFTKSQLPAAMCPAEYVLVQRIPLTSSGKTDRGRLLAQLDDAQRPSVPPDRAPRSPLERDLQAVWADVLDRNGAIDIESNFFDVGGNSLLLVRLQTRLKETLGHDISIVELMRHHSIAALARVLEGTDQHPPAQARDRPRKRNKSALANRASRVRK